MLALAIAAELRSVGVAVARRVGRGARQGKTTHRNCLISRRKAALNIATRVMHHLPNIKSIGMIYRCFHVKLYFIETILGRSEVGLLDAQNEVD